MQRGARSLIHWATLITSTLLLGACDVFGSTYRYRYRLTVEIETPQGLRTGSSVLEQAVTNNRITWGGLSAKRLIRTRGEAAVVELPGGQTLFALIPDSELVQSVLDPSWSNDWVASARRIISGRTTGQPLTMWVANGSSPARPAGYPKLVHFTDRADARSVAVIAPDNLAVAFGPGFRLRRIAVQLTKDPISHGISAQLPAFNTNFDRWRRTIEFGDPRGITLDDFKSVGE